MKERLDSSTGIKVYKHAKLAEYTSFRIGGHADYLVRVYSKKQLVHILQVVKKNDLKFFLIGAGTNLLFGDNGFRGVVVKMGGIFNRLVHDHGTFICGPALLLNTLVKRASDLGYGGVEFLAGIPGTIGGAVKGNAGAWGNSIGEIIERVIILDKNLAEKELTPHDVKFSYRSSGIDDRSIITSVTMKLKKKSNAKIRQVIKENLRLRKQRQPDGFSAGSFFKNPPGDSAGKLIEACGLKGCRIGDAIVSPKHGNFIINLGKAKASDVLELAKKIQKTVYTRTGIRLEPEVRVIK